MTEADERLAKAEELSRRVQDLRALGELELRGIATTKDAAAEIVGSIAFRSGEYSTAFLEETRLAAVTQ